MSTELGLNELDMCCKVTQWQCSWPKGSYPPTFIYVISRHLCERFHQRDFHTSEALPFACRFLIDIIVIAGKRSGVLKWL